MKRTLSAVLTATLLTAALSSTASAFDPSKNSVKEKNMPVYNSLLRNTIYLDAAELRADGTMYLYNPSRNIKVVDTFTRSSGRYTDVIADKTDVLKMYGGSYEYNEAAISGLYNVERAYDNFKALGYTPSSTLYVAVNSEAASSYSPFGNNDQRENAWVMPGDNVLFFGIGSEDQNKESATRFQGSDPDVVTHEYMHYITIEKMNWGYGDNETQAIAEAYSDIMAECMATTPDWKIGADSYIKNIQRGNKNYCVRNIANPEGTNCPDLPYNTNYSNWNDLKKAAKSSGYQNDPCMICSPGEASTILSHAAYLMNQNGISTDTLKKIWFNSLNYYNPATKGEATFSDCKEAVCQAAFDYLSKNGGRYYIATYFTVCDAFDAVGIQ